MSATCLAALRLSHRKPAFKLSGASLLSVLALILSFSGVLAQSEAKGNLAINGTILDPNGSIVQNATVIVKEEPSGQVARTTGDQHGHFSVAGLEPGKYSVAASA